VRTEQAPIDLYTGTSTLVRATRRLQVCFAYSIVCIGSADAAKTSLARQSGWVAGLQDAPGGPEAMTKGFGSVMPSDTTERSGPLVTAPSLRSMGSSRPPVWAAWAPAATGCRLEPAWPAIAGWRLRLRCLACCNGTGGGILAPLHGCRAAMLSHRRMARLSMPRK
jgi:hypothetical protein